MRMYLRLLITLICFKTKKYNSYLLKNFIKLCYAQDKHLSQGNFNHFPAGITSSYGSGFATVSLMSSEIAARVACMSDLSLNQNTTYYSFLSVTNGAMTPLTTILGSDGGKYALIIHTDTHITHLTHTLASPKSHMYMHTQVSHTSHTSHKHIHTVPH